MDILAEKLSSLGFSYTLYTHIDCPRQPDGTFNPLPLSLRNFPKNWDRLWYRYNQIDPYYHASIETSYVVDWQKVKTCSELSATQKESCRYLEDFGISNGITVPIHHHGGGFSAVSAICSVSDADWTRMSRQVTEPVFVTAHHFHDKYYSLYASELGGNNTRLLSTRESEIMKWLAYGKTVPEIAMILRRSPETVKFHAKNAYKKLDARNRGQAVSHAAKLGLL